MARYIGVLVLVAFLCPHCVWSVSTTIMIILSQVCQISLITMSNTPFIVLNENGLTFDLAGALSKSESVIISFLEASETAAAINARLSAASLTLLGALSRSAYQKALQEDLSWRDVPDMSVRTAAVPSSKKLASLGYADRDQLESLVASAQSRVESLLAASVAALLDLGMLMRQLGCRLASRSSDGTKMSASAEEYRLSGRDWGMLSQILLSHRALELGQGIDCGNLGCTASTSGKTSNETINLSLYWYVKDFV